MICENYIDCENDVTTKFLSNMSKLDNISSKITRSDEKIKTRVVDVPAFEIEYSEISEQIGLKEKKIFNVLSNAESDVFVEQIKQKLKDDRNLFVADESLLSKEDSQKLTNDLVNDAIIREEINCHIETLIVDDFNESHLNEDTPNDRVNGIDSIVPKNAESNDDKSYKCHLCDKFFFENINLKCHLKTHEESEDEPKKTTITQNEMTTENAEQPQAKEYKCIICGKSFARKSSLTSHYKYHPNKKLNEESNNDEAELVIDNKPYKCDICGKPFSRQSSLAMHLTLHAMTDRKKSTSSEEHAENKIEEGEPRVGSFPCDVCGKRFANSRGLKIHFNVHRIHEEPAPVEEVETVAVLTDGRTCCSRNHHHEADENLTLHECETCHKCFCNLGNYKKHTRAHLRNETEESDESSELEEEEEEEEEEENEEEEDVSAVHITKKLSSANTFMGLYRCGFCDRFFNEVDLLKKHVINHTLTLKMDFEDLSKRTVEGAEYEDDELYCLVCLRSFSTLDGLQKHAVCHEETIDPLEEVADLDEVNDDRDSYLDSLKCSCCDKLFTSIRALRIHISNHSQNVEEILDHESYSLTDLLKCDRCDRFFTTIRALKLHITSHTKNPDSLDRERRRNVFKCGCCHTELPSIGDLRIHLTTLHSKSSTEQYVPQTDDELVEPRECDICERFFPDDNTFNVHKSSHSPLTIVDDSLISKHEFDSLRCDCCDTNFNSVRMLKVHVSQNVGANVLRKSQLKSRVAKANERIDELEDESLKCDICNRYFQTERSLRVHRAHHTRGTAIEFAAGKIQYTTEEGGSYKCDLCDRSFGSLKAVYGHSSSHRNETPAIASVPEKIEETAKNVYNCKLCECTFTCQKALTVHATSHKNYSVETVKKKMQTSSAAAPVEVNYKCKFCDRVYVNLKALAGHMSVHNKVKNIENNVDDVNVAASHQQDKDVVNTKEAKVEVEDVCLRNGDLITHKLNVSPKPIKEQTNDSSVKIDSQFKCTVCERKFDSLRGMKIHLWRHSLSISDQVVVETEAVLEIETDQSTTKSQTYKCDTCDRHFDTLKALKRHIMFHKFNDLVSESDPIGEQGVKKLKRPNDVLDEAEQTPVKRERVAKSVPDELIFKCTVCEKAFSLIQQLMTHTAEHKNTSDVDTPFECIQCEKCFGDKNQLLEHAKSHADEVEPPPSSAPTSPTSPTPPIQSTPPSPPPPRIVSRYECHCGKTFGSKLALCCHSRVHKGEKRKIVQPAVVADNNCENNLLKSADKREDDSSLLNLLDKRSLRISLDDIKNLNNDSNNNDSERGTNTCNGYAGKFACELCCEKFDTKIYLRKHFAKHPDVVIECNYCAKKFLRKIVLKNHINKHTGGNDYRCWFCAKRFRDKTQLKLHVQGHKEDDLRPISRLRRKIIQVPFE